MFTKFSIKFTVSKIGMQIKNINILNIETTTTPAASTTTTTLAPTTETPDEGFKCKNSFYGVYADPERCDRFYTCSMKKATSHKCPGNWLFNSLTRTCAIPALVSCGDRVIPGHGKTLD